LSTLSDCDWTCSLSSSLHAALQGERFVWF
jgi:hypothetical protein